jgi:hypothetical protein
MQLHKRAKQRAAHLAPHIIHLHTETANHAMYLLVVKARWNTYMMHNNNRSAARWNENRKLKKNESILNTTM